MTDEELGYRRINAGVFLFFEYIKYRGTEKPEWNPYYLEHIADCNALFKDLYEDKIVAAIGETDWAINFVQYSQHNPTWMVDIYINEPEHYKVIGDLISNKVPKDMTFKYYYRGTIGDLLG